MNTSKGNKTTNQKEETQMVLTAFLICAVVGLAAGLMKSKFDSITE